MMYDYRDTRWRFMQDVLCIRNRNNSVETVGVDTICGCNDNISSRGNSLTIVLTIYLIMKYTECT